MNKIGRPPILRQSIKEYLKVAGWTTAKELSEKLDRDIVVIRVTLNAMLDNKEIQKETKKTKIVEAISFGKPRKVMRPRNYYNILDNIKRKE